MCHACLRDFNLAPQTKVFRTFKLRWTRTTSLVRGRSRAGAIRMASGTALRKRTRAAEDPRPRKRRDRWRAPRADSFCGYCEPLATTSNVTVQTTAADRTAISYDGQKLQGPAKRHVPLQNAEKAMTGRGLSTSSSDPVVGSLPWMSAVARAEWHLAISAGLSCASAR